MPVLTLLLACSAPPPAGPAPIDLTHGVTLGDAQHDRVLVWARGAADGVLHVQAGAQLLTAPLSAEHDHAATIALTGLPRTFPLTVWAASEQTAEAPAGTPTREVELPAPKDAAVAVRLAFGGDLGGQDACRHARDGYPVFDAVLAAQPDAFIALGDMIYADDVCTDRGRYGYPQVPGDFPRSTTLDAFRAHWAYNRADPALRALLDEVPVVAVWDDHEFVNDAGPAHDTLASAPDVHLLPLGARAFREWNPAPDQATRALRFGRHVELFALDTRSHRDPNSAPDDPENPKSMLGAAQRAWLVDRLRSSDATWKLVVTSVPLAQPTGSPAARDGWADVDTPSGFERELTGILAELRDAGTRGLVFLTTDVHFAAIHRLTPFEDTPEFRIHQVISGPLNAGLFPNPTLDDTLHPETLFFHGPASAASVTSWDEARRWFNFGLIEVEPQGNLAIRIVDANGRQVGDALLPKP